MSSSVGTWFRNDQLGATWNIMDPDGDILYYAGTLCGDRRRSLRVPGPGPAPGAGVGAGAGGGGGGGGGGGDDEDAMCPNYLPPGTYLFRVTGAGDPSIPTWNFCNTAGSKQNELIFKIISTEEDKDEDKDEGDEEGHRRAKRSLHEEGEDEGEGDNGEAEDGGDGDDYICVPLVLRNVTEVCAKEATELLGLGDSDEYTKTLEGSMFLGASDLTNVLTSNEKSVLGNAIIQEFSEAATRYSVSSEDVTITSWDVLSSSNSRQLSSGNTMGRLVFRVKVATRKLGIDGSNEAAVEGMAAGFRAYLHRSMSSGAFSAKVISHAKALSQKNLQTVNFAELLDLVVIHETKLNEEMSGVASIVVAVGALFGIVFGTILFRSYVSKQKYSALASSTHEGV